MYCCAQDMEHVRISEFERRSGTVSETWGSLDMRRFRTDKSDSKCTGTGMASDTH